LAAFPLHNPLPKKTFRGFKVLARLTVSFVPLLLALVILISGCDALKSLYGEIYGEDDGSDGGGSEVGSGCGSETGNIRGVPISFEGITIDPNGTTTLVSLVFDRDINGLSADELKPLYMLI
jgi:hypothetical protein